MPTQHATRNTPLDGYRALLWLAILGYIVLFSRLAFDLHLGMRTHKADLGQIAQAIWNSSRGRFVESTDTGIIASRLTDHVEPMLAFISPVLWLWEDVRMLLLLQVIFVAIGAWPLYELALLLLDKTLPPRERSQIWQIEPLRQMTRPMALALALAYLLAPQTQSAILTEFHAAPLVVPFLLWAFWAVEREQLWSFVIATLLVATVKEEMALLAAGLGVWATWRHLWRTRPITLSPCHLVTLSVTLAALLWFYLATFVIVPAHAPQIYDTAESVYFGRYGALGDSPADILKSFFTQPGMVWQIATEPVRLHYLWGLIAPFGWLSLLAPEIVLLSLPLLLANLLSAYPAQYYGDFHYSAPLVPYFAVSAAYGLARLWRWLSRLTSGTSASYQHLAAASTGTMALASVFTNARTALRPLIALACVLWLLGWGGATYREAGRGPFAARYDPTPITDHARLLPRFTAQIPADAAVTATAAVHPHLSLRRYLYQFPIGLAELNTAGQAEWALIDVTTNTDMAPGDLKSGVDTLLTGDWGVVDGADGFLLLQRGNPNKTIPDAFYDFARGQAGDPSQPTADAALTFVSVQVEDRPRWRETRVNACWQVGNKFAAAPVVPQLELMAPTGDLLYSFSAAAPPAFLWYPPEQWQAGETVCVKTLPLYLPRLWGVRVAPAQHRDTLGSTTQSLLHSPEGTMLVQLFERTASGQVAPLLPVMVAQKTDRTKFTSVTGVFRVDGQPMPLTLWSPQEVATGGKLDLHLLWGDETFADWPAHLVAFVHLRQGETTLAQADGPPRFFTINSPVAGLAEWRQLALPATLLPGAQVTVAIGLYDPVTGERVSLQVGNANEMIVGPITVVAPPLPDQACALIPATCAAQPSSVP
ncbi:MAG: DUF2079 domain-containing protein [Caldilinea sp. CFX5]|nr:DUF2079 domain-containing protein [Caldilinea sp. CFX5]